MDDREKERPGVGCSDYRAEMILLALRRRLEGEGLDEGERQRILAEIGSLEKSLGLC